MIKFRFGVTKDKRLEAQMLFVQNYLERNKLVKVKSNIILNFQKTKMLKIQLSKLKFKVLIGFKKV